jgi:uncharacterized protein (UPF0276 family)
MSTGLATREGPLEEAGKMEGGAHECRPKIGMGFRVPIMQWTMENIHHFDVFEITIDHYVYGGDRTRSKLKNLVGRIPLVAHGVGLSLGTDVPLDPWYVDQVARALDALQIPTYSEHMAWTKIPGVDLANLLPVPRTLEAAELLIEKARAVQAVIQRPFFLENITYVFDFPESEMSQAEFFSLVLREAGAGMLLDAENLYLNSVNHQFDPYRFIDELPKGIVKGVHLAGGTKVKRGYLKKPVLSDSHSDAVPVEALDLLQYALRYNCPETIIVERDTNLREFEELLSDVSTIRKRISTNGKMWATR